MPWGVLALPGGPLPEVPSYPCIVKPAWEGSSKGIRGKCVADDAGELAAALEERRDQQQPLLVEEFIAGEELTVGVLGNADARAIGTMRIVPLKGGRALRLQPGGEARLPGQRALRKPRRPCRHRRCKPWRRPRCGPSTPWAAADVARIDYRLRDGVPYFLEANPPAGPESGDERPGDPGPAQRHAL